MKSNSNPAFHFGLNAKKYKHIRTNQPAVKGYIDPDNLKNKNHPIGKNKHLHLPTLNSIDPNQKLKFGNYKYKEYGMIAPRMDPSLSLFEKLFLKNHINREVVRETIDLVNTYEKLVDPIISEAKYEKKTPPKIIQPNLSCCLFAKKTPYERIPQISTSITTSEIDFKSKSQEKRYKKNLAEFEYLRTKIKENPNQADLLATTVILYPSSNSLLINIWAEVI